MTEAPRRPCSKCKEIERLPYHGWCKRCLSKSNVERKRRKAAARRAANPIVPREDRECHRCGKAKRIKRKNGTVDPYCRLCTREKARERFALNERPTSTKRKQSKCIAERRAMTDELLLKSECIDCGEKNIVLLQYDHCFGVKSRCVSSMANNGYKVQRIMDEIAKCQCVCVSCHMIRTASRYRSRRYELMLAKGLDPEQPTTHRREDKKPLAVQAS